MSNNKIPFSVVTTCRNEMKSLPRWKQNILDQTRPPKEIVVVDAFSDDGTFEYLQEWAKHDKRIIVMQTKGAAAKGRNTAIENAKYEHILTTDMGVRLNDIWCEELISPFEKVNSIEVVAGSTCIDIETLKSAVSRAEFYIENGGEPTLNPGFIIGNRSSAYLKRIWIEVGGLAEDLTFYADDSVFGRQIVEKKYKMAFAPNAMSYWARPNKINQFWKEQWNYGRGGGEANIKKPRLFKLYQKGKIPWTVALFGNATWNLIKQIKFKSIRKCLKKLDFAALVYMPILAWGNGYNRIKGYKVGYEYGIENCTDCRSRLKQDW